MQAFDGLNFSTAFPTVKKNLLDLNQPSSYIYAKVGLLIFVISNVIELVV
jgi:hypothetical protein